MNKLHALIITFALGSSIQAMNSDFETPPQSPRKNPYADCCAPVQKPKKDVLRMLVNEYNETPCIPENRIIRQGLYNEILSFLPPRNLVPACLLNALNLDDYLTLLAAGQATIQDRDAFVDGIENLLAHYAALGLN